MVPNSWEYASHELNANSEDEVSFPREECRYRTTNKWSHQFPQRHRATYDDFRSLQCGEVTVEEKVNCFRIRGPIFPNGRCDYNCRPKATIFKERLSRLIWEDG